MNYIRQGEKLMVASLRAWRLILLVLCMALGASYNSHAQQWGRRAAFPEPSEELYGITAGGKLYVFGGQQLGWKSLGMVYEYDPAADRWSRRNPMPLIRAQHAQRRQIIAFFAPLCGYVSAPSCAR